MYFSIFKFRLELRKTRPFGLGDMGYTPTCVKTSETRNARETGKPGQCPCETSETSGTSEPCETN